MSQDNFKITSRVQEVKQTSFPITSFIEHTCSSSQMLALCSITFYFMFTGIPSFQVAGELAYKEGTEVLKLNQQPMVQDSKAYPNR